MSKQSEEQWEEAKALPPPPKQEVDMYLICLEQLHLNAGYHPPGCLDWAALLSHLLFYRFDFDMTEQQEGFCHPPLTTPEKHRETRLTLSLKRYLLPSSVTLKSHLIFSDMSHLATERTGDNRRRGLPWKAVEEELHDTCDDLNNKCQAQSMVQNPVGEQYTTGHINYSHMYIFWLWNPGLR